MASIWRIIVLVLHRYYPPRVFVFYPLYRMFRRRMGLPMVLSSLAVWLVSAILHGGVLAAVGSPVAGAVSFSIFVLLGILASIVIICVKPNCGWPRRRWRS